MLIHKSATIVIHQQVLNENFPFFTSDLKIHRSPFLNYQDNGI